MLLRLIYTGRWPLLVWRSNGHHLTEDGVFTILFYSKRRSINAPLIAEKLHRGDFLSIPYDRWIHHLANFLYIWMNASLLQMTNLIHLISMKCVWYKITRLNGIRWQFLFLQGECIFIIYKDFINLTFLKEISWVK